MPTWETSPEFQRLHGRLSPEEKKRYKAAVDKFVADLKRGEGFRNGLRVKGLQRADGMFEMTWAPDGRAVFTYGDSRRDGEPHVIWLAVGGHEIL